MARRPYGGRRRADIIGGGADDVVTLATRERGGCSLRNNCANEQTLIQASSIAIALYPSIADFGAGTAMASL
jgi:hypothetical protein